MKQLPDKRLTRYRQRLVEDNVRLVYWHVGKRLKGFHPDVVDEAVAQCMLGLIRAAQLFDKRRKADRTGKTVKFGTYAMYWVKCFFQRWTDRRVKEQATGGMQLSCVGRRDDGEQWEPASRDKGEAEAVTDHDAAARLLKWLTPRQRMVMEMRYFECLTLSQVGDRLGVTRERVRQIEEQAKTKLRRHAS